MEKYSYHLRILHWIMAILVIIMFFLGIAMTKMSDQNTLKPFFYLLHESIGVTFLILILLRLSIRTFTNVPVLPNEVSTILKKLSLCTHYILYLFMIIIPVAGFLGSMFYGYPVAFFNTEIPLFVVRNENYGTFLMKIHHTFPYIFALFIFLHIAAFIKHQFYDKIEILARISWKK
ncbi:Cytochrome b561 [Rickettsiales bacterium Ac37b]|nr:Cytochrome b561 [Rickettsiales bacterium Ac37b]